MPPNRLSCPCGSGKPYRKCCGKGITLPGAKLRLIGLPDGQRLPVAQALQSAMALHQAGRVRRAAKLYRRVLEVEPRQANALHLFGLTEYQLGNFVHAVALIQSAIVINPRDAMFHSNLSAAYRALNEVVEAETACRRAIGLDPSLPEAHYNLGGVLLLRKEFKAAAAAYTKALALRPVYVDALLGQGDAFLNMHRYLSALECYQQVIDVQPVNASALTRIGITLRKQGRVEDAIRHYEDAIRRCPAIPELHNNVAILYQGGGRLGDAAASLRRLLELTPDDAEAQHLLNAVEGTTTACAPAGYVRAVFDGYAEKFESHLVEKLGYRTPELLAEAVHACAGSWTGLSMLDLGCGTGLMGVALQDRCTRLVGVDLSPKMVERARAKGLYGELAVADILEFLRASGTASYDLLVAADVFVYIGDLRDIFAQARRVLSSGGLFAFSIEAADDRDTGFLLGHTGRYRHSVSYIRDLRDEFGFAEGYFSRAQHRTQGDQPVSGYLYVLNVPVGTRQSG